MRLNHLEGWVREWAHPQMYAGVAMQGATDATYQALADIERMTMEGTQYCGGAADIYKFFDQILRQLVYKVFEMAGMPPTILSACRRFLEELVAYNIILGGVGHG